MNQNTALDTETGSENPKRGSVDISKKIIMEPNGIQNSEKKLTDDCSGSISENSHVRNILQSLDEIELDNSDLSDVSILD